MRELDNIIQRAVILCDANARELDSTQLDLPATNTKTAVTSLEDYFVRFVLTTKTHCLETEIAQRLGISRKTWSAVKNGIPCPRGGKQPA